MKKECEECVNYKFCVAIDSICDYADEQYKIMLPKLEKLYKHSETMLNDSREWRNTLENQFPSFFKNPKRRNRHE